MQRAIQNTQAATRRRSRPLRVAGSTLTANVAFAVLKYAALTVAGVLLFRWGQGYALAERGYEAIGGEVIQFETPHMIRGGTYAIYGTQEAWLNITYNYGKHYRRVFGENGIRTIYGLTGAESIPIIKAAMEKLSDDISEDYWEATEGNAKKALAGLLAFAQMRPDGVWKGD